MTVLERANFYKEQVDNIGASIFISGALSDGSALVEIINKNFRIGMLVEPVDGDSWYIVSKRFGKDQMIFEDGKGVDTDYLIKRYHELLKITDWQ